VLFAYAFMSLLTLLRVLYLIYVFQSLLVCISFDKMKNAPQSFQSSLLPVFSLSYRYATLDFVALLHFYIITVAIAFAIMCFRSAGFFPSAYLLIRLSSPSVDNLTASSQGIFTLLCDFLLCQSFMLSFLMLLFLFSHLFR